jgi:hypothetical protein
MSKSVLRITTHLPAIPNWLKISNSMTFKLPLKNAKELAAKLMDVKEDVEVELNLATGKEPSVEIKYESKKETEPEIQ